MSTCPFCNRSTPYLDSPCPHCGKRVIHRPGTKRCSYWWERRTPGRRYVNARGQCTRWTAHPSGRCSEHRYGWQS